MIGHKIDSRGVRTFGPIPVSTMSLGIRILADNSRTTVDIGHLRGILVPVTLRLAGRLLGVRNQRVQDFIDDGVLAPAGADRGRGRDYVLFDPAWVLADLYENYVAGMPEPDRHSDFAKFDRIRLRCNIPDQHPVPEKVVDGLFRRLMEIGHFGRREASLFLSHNDVRWSFIKAGLNARMASFCSRRPDVPLIRISLEMLRKALPDPIANAPRTCFERQAFDQTELEEGNINPGREPPASSARGKLWRLKEFFHFGSLYSLVAAARMRRSAHLDDHLTIIARVEDIMRTHAPGRRWTRETYTDALRAYAIDRTIRPNDTPMVRDMTVRYWRVFVWHMQSYLRQQPKSVSSELRPFVPGLLRLSYEFRRELKALYGHLRAQGRAARKMKSHKAMEELDAIVDATTNRRDELRALGEAAREEMDSFADGEEYRDVGVELPILDARGNLAGGTQTIWLRIWRLAAAMTSIGLGVGASSERDGSEIDDGVSRAAVPKPDFIVEHRRTVANGAHKKRDPYMFVLDRLFVTSGGARLSEPLKEARHQAIAEGGFPGTQHLAAGTLTFDMWRAYIKRHGIEQGRHFVALEAIEYGIRLAFHALDCVNQSFNRPHEVRQQRLGGWEEIDLPDDVESDEPWHKQIVIGKVQPRRDLAQIEFTSLTIREASLNEAIDICELHMRYAGFDEFPVMKAPADFKWKCPPGRYLISSNGVTLSRFQLTVLVRYLLVGWPDFTLYDFRHANAEDAAFDHLHPRLIKLLLGQRADETAMYYSLLDEWAQKVVDEENLRRRMETQDARLDRTSTPDATA